MYRENVRCPRCMWHPPFAPLWRCVPSCRTAFDTFATRGRCPGCGQVWLDTQCPACNGWSPHEAWYLELLGESARERESATAPVTAF